MRYQMLLPRVTSINTDVSNGEDVAHAARLTLGVRLKLSVRPHELDKGSLQRERERDRDIEGEQIVRLCDPMNNAFKPALCFDLLESDI